MAADPIHPTGKNLGEEPELRTTPLIARFDPSWILLALLVLALFGVTQPSIRGNDGVQNYSYLRSLIIDGDLDFTNEYTHYLELQPGWFDHRDLPRDPVTSRPMNLYGVGSALLWSPAVWLTHQGIRILDPDQAQGYSRPYERAVGYSSAFYASVGLWWLWGILARRVGRLASFWAVILIWLGTPLFFYMHLHPSMSHGNSFFAVMLMIRILDSQAVARGQWLAWTALGASAGLLVLVRFQDAILLLAVAGAEAMRLVWSQNPESNLGNRLLKRIPAYLCCILAGAAMLSLQAGAWSVLQGSWWSGPRAYTMQGTFRWASPYLLQVWLSPYHGLFHWHPILLLGLAGLLLNSRQLGGRAVALLAFLSASYMVGCWSVWWAGASFGHRMFISSLPALALGFALMLRSPIFRRRSLAAPTLVAVAVWWNFGLTFQYAMDMIPRNRPVPISTILWNNTIGIPQFLLKRAGHSPVE